jgi:aryl-alcohol dehydrogenase-like predicted oxidoreductase
VRAEGLGVVNFYGLAKGFLSGKYRSAADLTKSPRGGGVKGYLAPKRPRPLAAAATCWPRWSAVAQAHGSTPAQVALAWQIASTSRSTRRP